MTSTLLTFEKLKNARDLGGMKTTDGRAVRPGRLFRSGHLADLTPADAERVASLVGTVVDFRTDKERMGQPDREIPGVQNFPIPIIDSLTAGISREEESDEAAFNRLAANPEKAKEYMCQTYTLFASDAAVCRYREFLRHIVESADSSGILWHCTAGKDRAGIASVIVEEILGIDREDITADYLKTNEYIEDSIRALMGFFRKRSGIDNPKSDEALRYMFGAERDYIDAYYNAIEKRYGSFEGFIRDGLRLRDETVKMLRDRYLS